MAKKQIIDAVFNGRPVKVKLSDDEIFTLISDKASKEEKETIAITMLDQIKKQTEKKKRGEE